MQSLNIPVQWSDSVRLSHLETQAPSFLTTLHDLAMYRHLPADFCRFINVSLVIVVLLQACLTVADHYECDWDPLGSLNPQEAGFTQLCSATPAETVSGTPPWAYYCNVEGANGARQYIVAGFGTRPGELEIGESLVVARAQQ